MSAETLEWHNVMSLIGNVATRTVKDGWHKVQTIVTADRGEIEAAGAWHYRACLQSGEPNHYAGPIPVEDVRRRLFSWKPEERQHMSVTDAKQMLALAKELTTGDQDPDAVKILVGMVARSVHDSNVKDLVRPAGALGPDDPGGRIASHTQRYRVHDYDQWLVRNVESILDDTLCVNAAGLLDEGARAWVEISVPTTTTTPEGVEFRPLLLSWTSLNGSMATGYGRKVQMTICDNTLAINLRDETQTIKFRHTTNSLNRINEAREALNISFAHEAVDEAGQAFMAEVAQLTNTTVSDDQWGAVKTELHPLTDEKGQPLEGRSRSYAINRQAELEQLYRHDPRCTPWQGTAFGVLQTVNTWTHHVAPIKGARALRNMDRAITGGVDALDTKTLATLDKVLVGA